MTFFYVMYELQNKTSGPFLENPENVSGRKNHFQNCDLPIL